MEFNKSLDLRLLQNKAILRKQIDGALIEPMRNYDIDKALQ